MDNNPLTYVLTTAKLSATGHLWLASLATYYFSLQYKPGRHNINAEVLSRYPSPTEPSPEWVDLPRSGVRAICQLAHPYDESYNRLVDQLGATPEVIPSVYVCPIQLEMGHKEQLSNAELRLAQEQDPIIGQVKQEVEKGHILTTKKSPNPIETLLWQQGAKFNKISCTKLQKAPAGGRDSN